MGRAINKTVTIAEIIKRRIQGLHQNTMIDSTPITEVWEPIEEGLERVETTRLVSSIQIILSNGQLDTNSPGYQPPIPEDQIQKISPAPRPRGGVGRGFRRGRGVGRARGGFQAPGQPIQPQMPPSALPMATPGFQPDQTEQPKNTGLRRSFRRNRQRLPPNQFNNNINPALNTGMNPGTNAGMNTMNPGINNFNSPGFNNNGGFNNGFNNGGFNNNYNPGFNGNFRGQGRGGRGGRGRGRGRPRGRGGFNRGQFLNLQPPRFPRGNSANLSNMNQQGLPQDGPGVLA